VRASYGSFASRDVAGRPRHRERRSLAELLRRLPQHADGYRDHAQSEKATFSGKWFYGPTTAATASDWSRATTGTARRNPAISRSPDARRDPGQSYGFTATDGGERLMNQVSAHLDADLGRNLYFNAKAISIASRTSAG
jgi:iron complex outermembrane receptor protein